MEGFNKNVAILIVGAGPGGLALAGRLKHLGIEFTVIEKTDKIASTWHNHYDRLYLHTIKEYSHLPHIDFPEDYPRYVSKYQLVEYYESYVEKMNIDIQFNTSLERIEKSNRGWSVICDKDRTYNAENVILATGVNRVPFFPNWQGQSIYEGELYHSDNFDNGKKYQDKKVLVIGMGNSGAEIALDLAEYKAKSYISIRNPINIVPRDFAGNPTQLTAIKLSKLPNWLSDWIGNVLQRLTIGDLSKYGIRTPKTPPAKQLREEGKTPVIDLGTVGEIKKGNIIVKPDIDHFYDRGVVFKDGSKEDFDAVISATGFKASLEEFMPNIAEHLDEFGLPKQAIGENEIDGLYFLGFDNYRPGGILGIVYEDSENIANHLALKVKDKVSAN